MKDLEKIVLENELEERIKWLIRLRWLAVIGVFLTITSTKYILQFHFPFTLLYLGNILLLFYNWFFYVLIKRIVDKKDIQDRLKNSNRIANLQIVFDLFMLTYFIHYTGGIENPFVFYFIFHMVIASILLSNKAAYLQASLAVLLIGMTAMSEYSGMFMHYHPVDIISSESCLLNIKYISGEIFVFTTTVFLTVYMTTSIVNRLRKGEKELSIANERLEKQDRLKSQYVLTVSHDLQSSLSTIQSCLKIVLDNLTGTISKKSREMIARAEERTRYLLQFVKELLDLSKIRTSNEIEKKRVVLEEIIKNVIEQLHPNAERKKLQLIFENSQHNIISANYEAMEELFINLLSNAIKYTPQGGQIIIKSRELTEEENQIQVSISDTGIGIEFEDISHIFNDFYRAENAIILEKEGTGLGLSIAKQIIEKHGGKISVESQVGRGSTFIFNVSKAN